MSGSPATAQTPPAGQPPPAQGAAEGLDGNPAWQQVGSFSGARGTGGQDLLANEVFRDSRNGDLFQDLGDLQVDLSHTWDTVSLGLNASFKRRVVERHLTLEPGATIQPDQLSYFQTINSALSKAQLTADYLKDRIDPFGVGFSSEAGFVITVAETKDPRPLGERPSKRIRLDTPGQELRKYWDSHGVHFDRHILQDAGKAVADFVGLLAGQIGANFEDTEAGAEFFEGFVEPLTMWTDLGVPIKASLFTDPDSGLRPGDAVSYVAFIEVAPLSAGMDKWGVKVNMKGFARYLRETTIVKEAGDMVLVRVKNLAARGAETTPVKIRPELKWLFLRYGYTFLSDRFDQSGFRASELVYRIDLENPRAADAFARLLATGHHVQFKPLLEAAKAGAGVEILASDYVGGRRHEHAFMARFPSGFRSDRRDIGVVRNVGTASQHYQEATRAKLASFRKSWGADRVRSTRTLLTLQSDPLPLGEKVPEKARPAALTVNLEVRDQTADRAKLAYLTRLLCGTLDRDEGTLGLPDLRNTTAPAREGATLAIEVSLGRAQLERMQAVTDEEIWRDLAEFYLGPTLRDTWSTPERRAFWKLRGPVTAKTGPAAPEIGRRLDSWLRAHREIPRGSGISADDYSTPSAVFFHNATGFMRRLHRLRGETAFGRLCPECWSALYADPHDVSFLQMLLVRGGGGIGDGGVGYKAEIWTDSMFRPVRLSNGISYTLHRDALIAPAATSSTSNVLTGKPPSFADTAVQSTEARGAVPDVDSIDSSAARIRAGRLFVETVSLEKANTPRVRLELYSDYRFDDRLHLRLELRRSRLRSDIPLRVQRIVLPAPVAVRNSPFMLAQFRYDLDWVPPVALSPKESYAIYLRVINDAGEPVSEEEAARFRLPKPRKLVATAAQKSVARAGSR